MGKPKTISEGVRMVVKDIKDRYIPEENFDISENWPLMMSGEQMESVYDKVDSEFKDIGKSVKIITERPAFNRITLDEFLHKKPTEETSLKEQAKAKCKEMCTCSKGRIVDVLLKVFPFINVFLTYEFKKSIVKDMVAGLSVGMIHIPQGMGFALLAGVAPVYGLYSSFFPVLIYFLFGQSRHVAVGTMAIISIVVGTAVDREAEFYLQRRAQQNTSVIMPNNMNSLGTTAGSLIGNSTPVTTAGQSEEIDDDLELYKASTASALSLIASALMLAMGIFRLGVIKTFMPTSFIGGFTTGAAFHIGSSQFSSMLGIKIIRHSGLFKLPNMWFDLASKLPLTNIGSLVISLIVLTLLISFKEYINIKLRKKLPIPIPIEVIILIVSTGLSYGVNFHKKWDVRIVGPIPKGVPTPELPVALDRASALFPDAFIAAILSFTITISMADIFARKYRYQIDTNHELISNALSYGIGTFFHSFIGAAAPPRCFIQETCGGKSKIASIFTFSLLIIVILFLGPLFKTLPNAVLGCIIFTALFPLYKQFKTLPGLWRASRIDFSIWIITWTSVTFLDVSYGLGIGLLWSILTIPIMAMNEKGNELVPTMFHDIYVPVGRYTKFRRIPDVIIFKFENGLYFATVKQFKKKLYEIAFDPTAVPEVPARVIVSPDPTSESRKNSKVDPPINGALSPQEKSETESNISNLSNGTDVNVHISEPIFPDSEELHERPETKVPIMAIVIDCSSISYIDLMGIVALKQLASDYQLLGVKFVLANCSSLLQSKLEADGYICGEGGDKLFVFPTIQDAVLAINYLRKENIKNKKSSKHKRHQQK